MARDFTAEMHAIWSGPDAGVPERVAAVRAANATPPALIDVLHEAYAHLGAAVSQTIPSDDQIIAGHVRDALALVKLALGMARSS